MSMIMLRRIMNSQLVLSVKKIMETGCLVHIIKHLMGNGRSCSGLFLSKQSVSEHLSTSTQHTTILACIRLYLLSLCRQNTYVQSLISPARHIISTFSNSCVNCTQFRYVWLTNSTNNMFILTLSFVNRNEANGNF